MSNSSSDWGEVYLGGSPESEAQLIKSMLKDILFVQADLKKRSKAPNIQRAFHAKSHLGVRNAQFVVGETVPDQYRIGLFQEARSYPATVRLSNASGIPQSDKVKDLRGLAVRLQLQGDNIQDFLATSAPASHVRDAVQFIAFARAMAAPWKLFAPFRLAWRVGIVEAAMIMVRAYRQISQQTNSLATSMYWSRGPFKMGPHAVKFLFRPVEDSMAGENLQSQNYLRDELMSRLALGDVRFEFCVQPFVDSRQTPIEDASVEWKETVSPPIKLAELIIPQQDLSTPQAVAIADEVEGLEFNPWHTADILPLGGINRARKAVYDASSDHRQGRRFAPVRSTTNRVVGVFARAGFWFLNNVLRIEWHQLPTDIGAMNLLTLRHQLRKDNLYDTRQFELLPSARPVPRAVPAEVRDCRQPDGKFNDLSDPDMGKTGMPFGRMGPLGYKWPSPDELMDPNPRLVSEKLLARDHFRPATSLNLLAAAWIQFQVHGWIDHRRYDHARYKPNDKDFTHFVEKPPGDQWPDEVVRVPKTEVEPTAIPSGRAFANNLSPWWSLSQVYGSNEQACRALRTMQDGKIQIDPATHRLLPDPEIPGIDHTGFNNNYWIGLSLLHTIFSLEHNAICDMLKSSYPTWTDEQIYQKARLINAAVNAKIHTVEWTPAIIFHPTIKLALEGNWWGAIRHGNLTAFAAGLVDVESKVGTLGAIPDHHNATYSLPEEFVTVYKMHPLIPDQFEFFSHTDGKRRGEVDFAHANGKYTREVIDSYGLLDVWYSFGVTHPGAITLQNFPKFLREFKTIEGLQFDLATHDIIRERERGIPRYNDFRELLHRPRVRSFEELTDNPTWQKLLKEVYGDVDKVDTMVGLFAEPLPPGFGFSDTAFRVFILTASRRLKSDRFFTIDYTAQVYTQEGIDWVEKNDMRSLILRHYPELRPALTRTQNTFHPWVSVIR